MTIPANSSNTPHTIFTPQRVLDPDALLTVEEVAKMLRVSTAWVRDHATRKEPRLPVVRLGKLLRFRRKDIEAWIAQQALIAERLHLPC